MKAKVAGIWNRLPVFTRNKFFLTGLAFLIYMLFFDSMDIPSQVKLHRHLLQLNQQTEYFDKMIEKDRAEYEATFSTVENMEQYARETYFMKRADEELFIIDIQ